MNSVEILSSHLGILQQSDQRSNQPTSVLVILPFCASSVLYFVPFLRSRSSLLFPSSLRTFSGKPPSTALVGEEEKSPENQRHGILLSIHNQPAATAAASQTERPPEPPTTTSIPTATHFTSSASTHYVDIILSLCHSFNFIVPSPPPFCPSSVHHPPLSQLDYTPRKSWLPDDVVHRAIVISYSNRRTDRPIQRPFYRMHGFRKLSFWCKTSTRSLCSSFNNNCDPSNPTNEPTKQPTIAL